MDDIHENIKKNTLLDTPKRKRRRILNLLGAVLAVGLLSGGFIVMLANLKGQMHYSGAIIDAPPPKTGIRRTQAIWL